MVAEVVETSKLVEPVIVTVEAVRPAPFTEKLEAAGAASPYTQLIPLMEVVALPNIEPVNVKSLTLQSLPLPVAALKPYNRHVVAADKFEVLNVSVVPANEGAPIFVAKAFPPASVRKAKLAGGFVPPVPVYVNPVRLTLYPVAGVIVNPKYAFRSIVAAAGKLPQL